ncbi:MAG: hypothetical protein ACR5LD_10355 [Symbiopectobacterium sp.]
MQNNWVKTVSDIRGGAEEIYRSAGEKIASGNTDLSSRTKEQKGISVRANCCQHGAVERSG